MAAWRGRARRTHEDRPPSNSVIATAEAAGPSRPCSRSDDPNGRIPAHHNTISPTPRSLRRGPTLRATRPGHGSRSSFASAAEHLPRLRSRSGVTGLRSRPGGRRGRGGYRRLSQRAATTSISLSSSGDAGAALTADLAGAHPELKVIAHAVDLGDTAALDAFLRSLDGETSTVGPQLRPPRLLAAMMAQTARRHA